MGGGGVPFGYDVLERQLVFNQSEAETVRWMFERYTDLKSVPQLVEEMAAKGIKTRKRVWKTGKVVGGVTFKTGTLTHLLQNPVYVGKVKHKENVYDGAHQPIITQELFDMVQSTFKTNRRTNALGKKSRNPSLLMGMITDPDSKPMTPTHATKGSKRFRYYVTRTLPGDQSTKWCMPAGEIERLVVDAVAKQLPLVDSNGDETAAHLSDQLNKRQEIASALPGMTIRDQRKILLSRKTRVQANEAAIRIYSKPSDQDEPSTVRKHSDKQIAQLAASNDAFDNLVSIIIDTRLMIVAGPDLWLSAKKVRFPEGLVIRVKFRDKKQMAAFVLPSTRLGEIFFSA